MFSINRKTIICDIKADDGFNLAAKIDYPAECQVHKVVLFCHGSGPNTFDNHRMINGMEFDYFELFASELCQRGIGFCRWNTRGCTPSNEGPLYVAVDETSYQTYYPQNSIADIAAVAKYLWNIEPFHNSKIILLGSSEGAMLAPFVAKQNPNISALLLMGFAYYNMKDTLTWQLSGGSSMVNMCRWFDSTKKGYITKEDFEIDPYGVRPALFSESTFENLDKDGDGKLTEQDFAITLQDYKRQVFEAISTNNDGWLKENYSVHLTAKWCQEHFALPPVSQPLMKLEIPVYVFRGEYDANIPFSDIEELKRDIEEHEKTNIEVCIFPEHDHDLNYLAYPIHGQISQGLKAVFEAAEKA